MILSGQYQVISSTVQYRQYLKMGAFPHAMHEHFECFYVRQGELTVTIDSVTVTLKPGDLSLAVPFIFHQNEQASNVVVDLLIFSPHICPNAAQIFSAQKPTLPYLRKKDVPPLVSQLLETLPQLFEAFPSSPRQFETFDYQLSHDDCGTLSAYLSVLLLELAKAMPLETLDSANISSMQNILSYCSANYTQDISRETVAQACHVSIGVISQTFARLNTSFRDYINFLRISKAHYLLTTTSMPITEIIYECGYSNQGTFNRNFYTQFGKTPRQVRTKAKDDSQSL